MRRRSFVLALSLSFLWFAGCSDYPSPSAPEMNLAVNGLTSPIIKPETPQIEYRLRLHHLHTDESVDVAYRRGQQYLSGGIAMLNHLLRDYRTGEDAHYPVQEFELLHTLMARLDNANGLIEIVCGYRTAHSNAYLRSRGTRTGVAENSQHVLSQAIDIRVPGVSTERLRDTTLALAMGGVGYYPQSGFVHVDVGPVRAWSFGGRRLVRTSDRTAETHHHHRPA